jgi:AcrR family transcriptional regulator
VAQGLAWLAERPLDTISVEELAAEVNVSAGLVFYYFESRLGLHIAILNEAADLFLAAFAPSLAVPAQDRARDAISRLVAFVRERGETFAAIARSSTAPEDEIRDINTRVREESLQYTKEMLAELDLPDTPIIDLAIHAWLVVVEQTLLEVVAREGSPLGDDEVVEFLTRTLFAMIQNV